MKGAKTAADSAMRRVRVGYVTEVQHCVDCYPERGESASARSFPVKEGPNFPGFMLQQI